MSTKSDNKKLSPEAQLRAFVGKYDPKNQKLFRSVRAAMRKRIPTANELAYDYSHALVISYAPAEHGIDAVVAISVRTDGVFLHFNQGPKLPDPQQLLRGAGKLTRFIQLRAASELANLDLEALIAAAISHASVPLPSEGKGCLIIKSKGAKKPSRRRSA